MEKEIIKRLALAALQSPKQNIMIVGTQIRHVAREIARHLGDLKLEFTVERYNDIIRNIKFTNGSRILFQPDENIERRICGYNIQHLFLDEGCILNKSQELYLLSKIRNRKSDSEDDFEYLKDACKRSVGHS